MNYLEKEALRVGAQLEKGFMARNFTLKIVMVFVIYPIAALISAFTEGTHLYTNFQDSFGVGLAAMAITVLIVLFIEIGQYFAINKVVDDLREGVFAEDMNHITAFVIAGVIGIVLMGISVTLSVQGAPITNEYFKKKRDPISLIDLGAINARYDAQIEGENASIAAAQKMTWKGKIVADGRALAQKATDQKKTIEQNRQAEISQAMADNQRITNEYNQKLQHSGAWFQGFAGLGEIIKLICLIFIGNYEAGARKEVMGSTTPSSGAQTAGFRQTATPAFGARYQSQTGGGTGAQYQRRPIGFHNSSSSPAADNKDPQPANADTDNRLQPVATDENAETLMSETPEYKEGVRDVLKNGVAPCAENKATIEMALKNAQSNLAAWKSKLRSGKGKPETNNAKIRYWTGVTMQLITDLQCASV